jgi:hypothetical protein
MAKAHSSRKRRPARAPVDPTKSKPTRKPAAKRPDLREILGRFSEALAVVETAFSALESSQEDDSLLSPGVVTLERGIDELKRVYTEFDVATAERDRGAS